VMYTPTPAWDTPGASPRAPPVPPASHDLRRRLCLSVCASQHGVCSLGGDYIWKSIEKRLLLG
jgi:hypothetical protein